MSTRVRTAQDSVVFVPNGKVVDSTINNLGTRRHHTKEAKLLFAESVEAAGK